MKVIGNLTKDAIIRAAVSEGLTVTQVIGTPAVFEAAQANNVDITYDSNAQKVVIVFTDEGNSSYGNAIVGTVSGNAISYGSPVIFESAASAYTRIAYDANAQKVVVVYRDTGNSSYGTAIVGTVSGTSISFGSPVVFDSQSTIVFDIEYDSNAQKLVIIHRRSDNQGRAIVGTVSGTSISFGTSAVFNAAVTGRTRIAYDANAQKVVLAYEDAGNSSHGTAIVGTVSGTGISFGSEVVFEAATSSEVNLAYDSDSQKIVIGYRDQGDSNIGKAIVGTVSGTSISFGTAAAFGAGNDEYITVVYDSDVQKIVVAYSDTTTNGKLNVGTVSGTSITFGNEVQFESGRANYVNAVYDTVQKRVVIAYQDAGNSSHGTAVVTKTGYTQATGGTIADGKAVIVNANGTVSSVGESALTEAKGSEVEFEAGATYDQGVVYDSANDKVVIFYRDAGNSDYGTAIVGTVSGDSISFGTAVVFESAYSSLIAPVFDSSNNKIVVAYRDGGNSGAGTAIVGTVSGTSISFGTAVVFESGNSNNFIDASFDTSANKVVIAFRDNDDSNNGKAIVGTVSGTSISFGSANTFLAATTQHGSIAYDVANNRHVIACQYTSGIAIVATVSGTSIAFGSQSEFETGSIIHTKALYDPNIERVHVFYGDAGDNDKGKAVIGTVSDTSISFTGQATFYGSAQVTDIGASFNTSISAITLATRDNGGALNMYTSTATTSAYTFGSAFSIDTGVTNGNVNNAHVSTADRTVLAFTDVGDSNKGKAVVYTGAGNVTNLTTENFVGFMDGAALDGTNGEILSSCSIARNQTSLTPGQTYFVTGTGALSTTAGDPSVTAGTAISNTELIVKG